MEVDSNINDILREVIMFLEYLQDEQLPLKLENLRKELLERSKNTLSVTTMARSSPEPYLDMKCGVKTILLPKNEVDTEEYVGMEESPQKKNHQDHYETFEHQDESKLTVTDQHTEMQQTQNKREEVNQDLISIYKNLSAMQSKTKCHKCGPLQRKESKKLFMSDSRACWIALVGSYLLIYRNERHNRPGAIYPIRGYMARPVPNVTPRERQKSNSTFEMYCPGSETLQFTARTPKDMQQWVMKVCEIGSGSEDATSNEKVKNHVANRESSINHRGKNSTSPQRRHVDESTDNVKKLTIKSSFKAEVKSNKNEALKDMLENPLPLPTRIPRRLPSVPPSDSETCYKAMDEYDDDDDIYYKIDDLTKMTYQNVMLAKKQHVNVSDQEHEETASKGTKGIQEKISDAVFVEDDMYDDIFVLRVKRNIEEEKMRNNDRNNRKESVYNDVENLLGKSIKDDVKDQVEPSSKFLQKKSFLERVWNRKDILGKTDKKLRDKVSPSPIPLSSTTQALPIYNDISNQIPNQDSPVNNEEGELLEYNCLPPPRPICTQPLSTINQVDLNLNKKFYDDVSAYRNQCAKNHQTILQSSPEPCTSVKEVKADTKKLKAQEDLSNEDIEHYQSPRSDLRVPDTVEYQNEEEYDDIALYTKFKARQRDVNEKKDNEDSKKSWNRFNVNKKSRSGESVCLPEMNRQNIDEEYKEADDSIEATSVSKRNTFQKLISKMENSLSKVSTKGPNSFPMNKPASALPLKSRRVSVAKSSSLRNGKKSPGRNKDYQSVLLRTTGSILAHQDKAPPGCSPAPSRVLDHRTHQLFSELPTSPLLGYPSGLPGSLRTTGSILAHQPLGAARGLPDPVESSRPPYQSALFRAIKRLFSEPTLDMNPVDYKNQLTKQVPSKSERTNSQRSHVSLHGIQSEPERSVSYPAPSQETKL